MKIAVINFSGNVGKTTIARHLLAPRVPGAEIIQVESVNSDDGPSIQEALRGKQFSMLLDALAVTESAVVDVGASNAEDFLNKMQQYHGSHEDFDLFVVPAVARVKQQRDTISTIEALHGLGVQPKKIKVVLNLLEHDDLPESVFAGLAAYSKESKTFSFNARAAIRASEIFAKIGQTGQTIADLLSDQTDFKAQLIAAQSQEEKVRISRLIGLRRLAGGVYEEMDAVFKTITAGA